MSADVPNSKKNICQMAPASRRDIFAVAIAGVLSCAVTRFTAFDSVSGAQASLLAVLTHRESAAEIGKMSLRSWPEMADRDTLLREIGIDLDMSFAELVRARVNQLRARMSQRVQKDFAQGRTVRLDGWLLSLAEVRLCVVAALSKF